MIGIGTLLDFGDTETPYAVAPSNVERLTPGSMAASAFLTATGLTYTRTNTSTVVLAQTAPGTLVAVPGGADVVSIEDRGFGVGATCEGAASNILSPNARQVTTAAGWLAADAGTTTYPEPITASPDGTFTATHIEMPSGHTSNHTLTGSFSSTTPGTFSFWVMTPPGSANPCNAIIATTVIGAVAGFFPTWTRISMTLVEGSGSGFYCVPVFSADASSGGGGVAGDKSSLVDCVQIDLLPFPTIFKGTAGGARNADIFSYPAHTYIQTDGSLSVWRVCIMECASGDFFPSQSYLYIWEFSANDWARINISTRKLEISSGGTVATSTNAGTWLHNDRIEFFTRAGFLDTVGKCRITSGGITTVFDFAMPVGPLAAFIDQSTQLTFGDSTSNLFCLFANSAIYKSGKAPSWV